MVIAAATMGTMPPIKFDPSGRTPSAIHGHAVEATTMTPP
jgi:hypothetical protein